VRILTALGIAGAAVHDKAHSRCQRAHHSSTDHINDADSATLPPSIDPASSHASPLAQQNTGPRLPKQRQRCLGRTFFFVFFFFSADLLKLITFIYLGLIHGITTPR
jgi:hypothetical protein